VDYTPSFWSLRFCNTKFQTPFWLKNYFGDVCLSADGGKTKCML
jgi:hypothetical protein